MMRLGHYPEPYIWNNLILVCARLRAFSKSDTPTTTFRPSV
jgi:hypothetical protein